MHVEFSHSGILAGVDVHDAVCIVLRFCIQNVFAQQKSSSSKPNVGESVGMKSCVTSVSVCHHWFNLPTIITITGSSQIEKLTIFAFLISPNLLRKRCIWLASLDLRASLLGPRWSCSGGPPERRCL